MEKLDRVRKFVLARTLLGRGLYYTAAYWVDGLMIDTGCAHTVSELVPAVRELAIGRIVNTHSHEDHIGANAAIQEMCGAEIRAHPKALPVLASPHELQRLRPYQVVMWGYPEPSQGSELNNLVETEKYRFEVIPTPGHSPDHVCLHEKTNAWLFTGDAYIGGRDRALRADYNIWEIVRSLKKLAALDAEVLFSGSGRVYTEAGAVLKQKISYLEEKGEQVLDLHRQGLSYGRIRRQVFGRELLIAYLTLGNFSGRNLVRSYVEDRSAD